MSGPIYSNAALVTAFLATTVVAADACKDLFEMAPWRTKAALLCAGGANLVALIFLSILTIPELRALQPLEQQLVLGTILLVIGMRWLRQAIFHYMDVLPESSRQTALSKGVKSRLIRPEDVSTGFDSFDFVFAFRTGFPHAFQLLCIIVALALTGGTFSAVVEGALFAAASIFISAFLFKRIPGGIPAVRIKFAVGALLSGFGTFWTAQGLGFDWPDPSITILVLAFTFWGTGWAAVVRGGFCEQKYATIIPFKNPIP